MSGHSHWAGIKHKKGAADQKRGEVFGKLLAAISIAAKSEPNPDFNPRLRTAVEKAKAASVPKDKIESAVKRASDSSQNLEELIFEAYGPGGTAIFVEVISDNRNRSVAEIKKILNDFGGKWAEPGSVKWAFEKIGDAWRAKFEQELPAAEKEKVRALTGALEKREDVQKVYTNAK